MIVMMRVAKVCFCLLFACLLRAITCIILLIFRFQSLDIVVSFSDIRLCLSHLHSVPAPHIQIFISMKIQTTKLRMLSFFFPSSAAWAQWSWMLANWLDRPDLICTRAWNRTTCWKDFNCRSFNSTLMYEMCRKSLSDRQSYQIWSALRRNTLWMSSVAISWVSIRWHRCVPMPH